MERQEIYQLIDAAKNALKPTHKDAWTIDTKVTEDAHAQYMKEAKYIFGEDPQTNKIIIPQFAAPVIDFVRGSNKKSTLRKRARSVRYAASRLLEAYLKKVDQNQRKGDWRQVEILVSSPMMTCLTTLAEMMPADYSENWKATEPHKGKKSSLLRLPDDWRELMANKSTSKYRIPMIVALLTGCRPKELENGVTLKIIGNALYVHIIGVKVKENAGQKTREFRLADHALTSELMRMMESIGENEVIVQVKKGNSVTTHMRNIANKLWPRRKESITVYSARHAMAADCKAATAKGAEEDLVSKVLGHVVDKTASYYGDRTQSGSSIVVPSEIIVPREIKHKSQARSVKRKEDGTMQAMIVMARNKTKKTALKK